MHKIYILLLASILVNISVSKANKIDSIGVENNKGKKLIVHRVESKETYYSIAKKYSVNYKDIMTYNDSKFLQIGVILKVPTEIPFTSVATVSNSVNNGNNAIIEYTIKAKDNLNMLANKYGTTVNEIKEINGLSSNNLQIGQVLKIPNGANNTQPEKTAETISPVQTAKNEKITPNNNLPLNNIEHTVIAKENLNLLAEKYGTTVEEIKRLNGLTNNNLRIGQVLKISSANAVNEQVIEKAITPNVIPSTQAVVAPTSSKQTPTAATAPYQAAVNDGSIEHTVTAGETIYSIAKKYGLTTYQLKTPNNLSGNEVTIGQKLVIKGNKPIPVNNSEEEEESIGTNPNTIKDPLLKLPANRYGLTQFEEKGTAVWIADQDLDASKMLVLHRTAPIGTVIKVTNPMSNRSAFAKVVGKFTENETTKDVIIVITKAVADAVGALDKRFFCNINYGAQENEQ